MKKLIILCVTLSIAAISGAVVLKSLMERQWMSPELMANEQALAGIDGGQISCYQTIDSTHEDNWPEDIFCGVCQHIFNSRANPHSETGGCINGGGL